MMFAFLFLFSPLSLSASVFSIRFCCVLIVLLFALFNYSNGFHVKLKMISFRINSDGNFNIKCFDFKCG